MSITKVTYSMIDGAPANILDFGAGPTKSGAENAAAINAAIAHLYYTYGGGTVFFPTDTYTITSPIIVPSYISVDLNRSTIVGGGLGTNSIFESGYDNNGTIVSNITNPTPEAPGTVTIGLRIYNGYIKDSGIAINLFNAIWQSEIRDIEFTNTTQAVKSQRSFYSRYKNLISTGAAGGETAAAFEFNYYVNVEAIESVFVSNRFRGIYIAGTASSIKLLNCSAENNTTGIYIVNAQDGGVNSIELDTCYIEKNTTGVSISSGRNANSVAIKNSFINYNTTGIYIDSWGNIGQFNIDKSTSFANNTTNISMNVADPKNQNSTIDCNTSLVTPYISNSTDLTTIDTSKISVPAIVDKNAFVNLWKTSTSSVVGRVHLKKDSIIPFMYDGDSGNGYSDKILCATTGKSPGTYFTLYVYTQIAYQPITTAIVFSFTITTPSATYPLYGFILGNNVVRHDGSGAITITTSNNAGHLQLNCAGVTSNDETFTVSGFVRHI